MDDKLNQDEIEALLAGANNNEETESGEISSLSADELGELLSGGEAGEDDNFEFINDVSVFDTVEREDPLEEMLKDAGNLFDEELEIGDVYVDNIDMAQDSLQEEDTPLETAGKKSSFILTGPVIIGVLLLMIMTSIGVGYRIINIISDRIKPENETLAQADRVTQSSVSTNSANYTYLTTDPFAFGSGTVEVIKISFDSEATSVFFKNNVDWSKFQISLVDGNNKAYSLLPDGACGLTSDRLVFTPINTKVRGIVLTITEKTTGEEVIYPFMFNQNIKIAPVAYLNSAKGLVDNDFVSIKLLNASFSSSQSNLTYALTWKDDREVLVDNITLTSGTRQVFVKENGTTKIKEGENSEIYNLKFGPLNSFKDQISLNFNGVYFKYNMGTVVDSGPLFEDTEQTQKRISVGENTIILERMGAMGPYFVLVAHCENESGTRVYADYEISLELFDNEGKKYILDGKVKTDVIGTDVLFDVRTLGNFEKAVAFNAGNVTIHSSQIKTDNISVSIDLSGHEYSKTTKSQTAIDMAETFLTENGAVSVELITYYWDGGTFNAYYKVYENGELKRYLLTSQGEGVNMRFKKTQFGQAL